MSGTRIVVRTTRVERIKVKTPSGPGARGPSAYQVAVEAGFVGTVEEWLASLQVPADLPAEPTNLEIETGTAPGIFSWSVLKAKFAFSTWIAAWKTATLGTAAVANTGDFDAAGAAGAVQGNLNTHLGDVAPHFAAVSQVDAEAGTSQALGWWSPQRIAQAIAALAAPATPAGGWEQIGVTQTVSTPVSAVDFTGVSGYKEYRIIVEGCRLSVTGTLMLRFYASGVLVTSNYVYVQHRLTPLAVHAVSGSDNAAGIKLTDIDNNAYVLADGEVIIYQVGVDRYTSVLGHFATTNSQNGERSDIGGGCRGPSGLPIDGFRIYAAATNVALGKFRLEGRNI